MKNKKRNPQDATLRNINALKKKVEIMDKFLRALMHSHNLLVQTVIEFIDKQTKKKK